MHPPRHRRTPPAAGTWYHASERATAGEPFGARTVMTRTIGIALLGLGNVGGGVVKLLEDNAAAIEQRLGARLEVRAVVVRDPDKANRVVEVDRRLLTTEHEPVVRRA